MLMFLFYIFCFEYKSSNLKLLKRTFMVYNSSSDSQERLPKSNSEISLSSNHQHHHRKHHKLQSFDDESESIINLFMAANLNENTFHLSPNDTDFYTEQLKLKVKAIIRIEVQIIHSFH